MNGKVIFGHNSKIINWKQIFSRKKQDIYIKVNPDSSRLIKIFYITYWSNIRANWLAVRHMGY